MESLKFKGKNKDFKIYLDNIIKELEQKEKRSSTSANAQAPNNNSTNTLYTKQSI